MKLLTCLWLNFSHLHKHRFRHDFRDTTNPMCSCGAVIETTDHYLLRCQNFGLIRSSFLNRIFTINVEFRNIHDLIVTSFLLLGSEKQTFDVNTKILNITITVFKRFWSFWWGLNTIIMSKLGTYRCISLFRIYIHLIFSFSFFLLLTNLLYIFILVYDFL